MATFRDNDGHDWQVEFDGLILQDVEVDAGVDLADFSAGGLFSIEEDVKKLVAVLIVLCRDQMQSRDINATAFAKSIRKDAITRAKTAVLEAAEAFFPQSEWSVFSSNLKSRRTTFALLEQFKAHRGAKTTEIADELIMGILEAGLSASISSTDLQNSGQEQSNPSAGGSEGIPSTSASPSQES